MNADDVLKQAREAQKQAFLEQMQNYGMLLSTMTPEELGQEIGKSFPVQQSVIVSVLASRVIALEETVRQLMEH